MTDTTKYQGRSQTVSANAARVSELVGMAADEMALATKGERIPLTDISAVQAAAERYLRECSASGVLPSVRGLAARLGYTRQALYAKAARNPVSEFAKLLEDFSDSCGELTMQAALEGTISAIPGIFVAKARYGWREPPSQIELGRTDPLGDLPSAEDIAAKYRAIVSDSEEED